jgi:acetyl esterase/lipase
MFMRRSGSLLVAVLWMGGLAMAQKVEAPQLLWPGAPAVAGLVEHEIPAKPGAKPELLLTDVTKPTMTVYRPAASNDKHFAIVVFPGGGYSLLAYALEGTEVCDWINSMGGTAVLVKYRVPSPKGEVRGAAAIEDGKQALKMTRARLAEWGIAGDHLGVVGFSAGGNLSVMLSTQTDVADRPAFTILGYPAYLSRTEETVDLAENVHVDKATSRTFMVQAEDDKHYINSSIAYYIALKAAGVDAELHVYAKGGHGFGLRPTRYAASEWPKVAERWLKSIGVL